MNIISRNMTDIIFIKKISILIFLICLSILNLSCQKSVLEKPVNPIDSLNSDPITFKLPEGSDISADLSSNVLLENTADIFLFAEGLIELGRLSDKEFFTELGHRVMLKFYEDKNNYTSYSFCDDSYKGQFPCDESVSYNTDIPYIGVALGAKDVARHDPNYLHEEHEQLPSYGEHNHPDCDPNKHGEDCDPNSHVTSDTIAGLYSYSMQGVIDYIEDGQFFENIDINSIESEPDSEDPFNIDKVLNFLEEIKVSISEDISEVSTETKDGVLSAIETAKVEIVVLKEGLNASVQEDEEEDFIEGVLEVFGNFLNIDFLSIDVDSIQVMDDGSIHYTSDNAESIQNINSDDPLKDIFNGMIELKKTYDQLNRFLPAFTFSERYWFATHDRILNALVDEINNNLPKVPGAIKNIVISEIEQEIDPDNIYNIIYFQARGQAKQKIFKDRATLPGVEFSNVKMVKEPNDIVSFSVDEDTSLITDGLTLGTAMSVLVERLKQMETYESSAYNMSKNYQPLFSLFNKSLSLVGHYQLINANGDGKTYEEVIMTSFFRPFRITSNQTKEDSINPYNYYGDEDDGKTQPGYFAIPEKVILESGKAFAVDLSSTQQGNMFSTVVSQAEMIRGASKVLSYLRPDRLTGYDETMGALNLASDTDQEGDVSASGINQALFPKSSFFNLHLGIAGIVLTNLRRGGVLIHTLEGESILGNEFGEGQEGVTPLLVSVHDVREGHQDLDEEVKTIDVARLMIAIEEFMLAVEDIDKIDTPDLSDFSRESYQTVDDGVDKLKEVNLGLHFSMMIELQEEDGGFIISLNIVKSHQVRSNGVEYHTQDEDEILLDTQVQALLALTRFYKRSMEEADSNGPRGGRLRRSILEGFNCITEKLFDSQNHFFVTEEETSQKPSLRLATDFLRLTYKLDDVVEGHNDWMQKLNDFRTRWTEVYIEQLRSLKKALSIPEETRRRVSFFSEDLETPLVN